MNDDLISRSELANHKFLSPDNPDYSRYHDNATKAYQQGWNDAIDAIIDNAPTVLHDNYSMGYQDGVKKVLSERPTGEWISANDGYYCDKCYGKQWYRSDYCPQCGADMRVKHELNNELNELGGRE